LQSINWELRSSVYLKMLALLARKRNKMRRNAVDRRVHYCCLTSTVCIVTITFFYTVHWAEAKGGNWNAAAATCAVKGRGKTLTRGETKEEKEGKVTWSVDMPSWVVSSLPALSCLPDLVWLAR